MLMIYILNFEIVLFFLVCFILFNKVCIFRDVLSYVFRGVKNLIFMKLELFIYR